MRALVWACRPQGCSPYSKTNCAHIPSWPFSSSSYPSVCCVSVETKRQLHLLPQRLSTRKSIILPVLPHPAHQMVLAFSASITVASLTSSPASYSDLSCAQEDVLGERRTERGSSIGGGGGAPHLLCRLQEEDSLSELAVTPMNGF